MGMTNKVQRGSTMNSGTWASSLSMFLKAWLDHDLSMARAAGRSLAVFVIRVDEYHDLVTGCDDHELEAAMAEFGSRLKKMLQPADASVRSSEDGFTIIHLFSGDPLALHGMAKAMLQQLQQPVRLGADDRCFAASIGIAFYPEDGNGAERLLENAHDALRRTDRWGGNGFCLYSRSVAKQVADHLSKHEDLRRTLAAGDLSMRFQPIFDLSRDHMTAVSGNVHWQHPTRGRMSGADVASIADASGLVPRLNEWLVDEIFRQLNDWRHAGIDRSISIDVSRSQIVDGHLARLLSARLSATGVNADLLELCVDHDVLSNETDHRVRTGLQHLADLGIAMRISNVGSGPLAFQSLQQLPITSADLAPDMIAAIGRCSSSEMMLEAVIGFIHVLGLCVRAVGVCSREQLDFLKCHGCDEASGPFLAPALKGVDIDRLTHLAPCIGGQGRLALVPQLMSMH